MNVKNVNTKDVIFQLISNKIKLIIALFFTIILIIACRIIFVVSFSNIIENLFVKKDYSDLPLNVTLITFSVIFSFIMSITKKKQLSNLGTYLSTSLIDNSYSAILCSEMTEIEKTDINIRKMVNSCRKIGEEYISENIFSIVENIIFLFTAFITLLIIKPALGLIAYIGLPFMLMAIKGIDKLLARFTNKNNAIIEKEYEQLESGLKKVKNIKLDNSIKYEKEKLSKISEEYVNNSTRKNVFSALSSNLCRDLILGLMLAIVIGVGGWLASEENLGITAQVLTIFVLLVPEVYLSFRNIMKIQFMPSFIENELETIDEILNLRTEIKSEPVNTIDEIHSIRFANVSYGDENCSYANINFELKRGEKLGIFSVDTNFKNSVFNIITKISKPKDGSVTINNCDIAKINTSYLRDLITSIYDESVVFEDTIKNNISYPLEFDEYKYNDALNKSGLKDVISKLPLKENTIIGNDEFVDKDSLQRIIYANAFYKDSKIYVLKDATKDYALSTESQLLKEVFNLKNKAVILLTDKIYNLVGVDKVLIFENGEVTEYGKYDELLQNKTSRLHKLMRKPSSSREKKVS